MGPGNGWNTSCTLHSIWACLLSMLIYQSCFLIVAVWYQEHQEIRCPQRQSCLHSGQTRCVVPFPGFLSSRKNLGTKQHFIIIHLSRILSWMHQVIPNCLWGSIASKCRSTLIRINNTCSRVKLFKFLDRRYSCFRHKTMDTSKIMSSNTHSIIASKELVLCNQPLSLRVKVLLLHSVSPQALADLVSRHLHDNQLCTNQLTLRCPMCVNPVCDRMRQYFMSQKLWQIFCHWLQSCLSCCLLVTAIMFVLWALSSVYHLQRLMGRIWNKSNCHC